MDNILSAEITYREGESENETLIKFNLEDELGERREYPYFHSLEKVMKSYEAKGLGKYVKELPEDLLIELIKSSKLQNDILLKKKGDTIPAEECIAGMTFQPDTEEEPRKLKEEEAEKAQNGEISIKVGSNGLRIAEQIDLLPPEGKAYELYELAEEREDKRRYRRAKRAKLAEEAGVTLEEFEQM